MPRYFFDIDVDLAVTSTEWADLPDDEAARAFADGLASTLPVAGRTVEWRTVVIRPESATQVDPSPKPER